MGDYSGRYISKVSISPIRVIKNLVDSYYRGIVAFSDRVLSMRPDGKK